MGKILLICIFSLCFWATISFGQSGDKSSLTKKQAPFVENNLKQVDNPIDFFPNPATDFLHIEVNDNSLKAVEFEIYNIIGNSIKIEVEEIAANKYKIPVSSLSQGYYLLVVQDKGTRFKQAYKFQKK